METTDFSSFLDKQCKFKLRSGKEVYGVIWEDLENTHDHFFASSEEYLAYKIAKAKKDNAACEKLKFKLNIEDVVSCECLEDKNN